MQTKIISPGLTAIPVTTQHGQAVRFTGKGAREMANRLAAENYRDGRCDTKWHDVRHGLGYLVPLYSNPLTGLL